MRPDAAVIGLSNQLGAAPFGRGRHLLDVAAQHLPATETLRQLPAVDQHDLPVGKPLDVLDTALGGRLVGHEPPGDGDLAPRRGGDLREGGLRAVRGDPAAVDEEHPAVLEDQRGQDMEADLVIGVGAAPHDDLVRGVVRPGRGHRPVQLGARHGVARRGELLHRHRLRGERVRDQRVLRDTVLVPVQLPEAQLDHRGDEGQGQEGEDHPLPGQQEAVHPIDGTWHVSAPGGRVPSGAARPVRPDTHASSLTPCRSHRRWHPVAHTVAGTLSLTPCR
ncbi:hypothetical protein STSP_01230 [Streptomyces jeddahensis]|uniref:Uncharacterized protein n=1 Tax=Streptomyces jeddahensis TaxID=1716141 RepID=A0A177I2C5_9ACTN|nr:hypothetical protein STSP_01230 [Streptomyces jeddahensis]